LGGVPDYSLHHANRSSSETGLGFGGDETGLKRAKGGRNTIETDTAFRPESLMRHDNFRMHGNNERTHGVCAHPMSQ